jgi:hypothetical protein
MPRKTKREDQGRYAEENNQQHLQRLLEALRRQWARGNRGAANG